MQAGLSQKLLRMFVGRIIEETFPNETAAARLQQIGLFTLIYVLQGDDEPVTAQRLSAMTGLSDAQIIRQLKKLMAIGLIERTQILNRQGRGRAFHLTVKHNAKTRRLARMIEKAEANKRR